MMRQLITRYIPGFLLLTGCMINSGSQPLSEKPIAKTPVQEAVLHNIPFSDTACKTIHVVVALCSNRYQGVVPVPNRIGDGKDPANNLYWGCGFGIRTFFKNSKDWKLLSAYRKDTFILERLIFRHATSKCYLVADAYDGQYIKQGMIDFFSSCAGIIKDTVHLGDKILGINGNSGLIAYVGHDGLMDFDIENSFENTDGQQRSSIMMSCASSVYFAHHMRSTKAFPLIWTTGLMCPEAYTLHEALTGYMNKETNEEIRLRVAQVYARYQKCSIAAAGNLFKTGW